MAQRLVRTLCQHCREPGELPDEAWQALIAPWQAEKPKQVYFAKGCLECRMTGYLGRMGIYEIMFMTDKLRPLVHEGADMALIREQANRDGMKPLRIGGARKVVAGITTVEEVMSVAPPVLAEWKKKPASPSALPA